MLCTPHSGENKTCLQDEGSALMCRNAAGLWELQGVYSSHGNCRNHNKRPQVMTSIPAVREWVDVTVGMYNLL